MQSFVRRLLRLFGMDKWFRKDGLWETCTLPCAFCKKVKRTTVGEVWCKADPVGRMVRLCKDCTECCA